MMWIIIFGIVILITGGIFYIRLFTKEQPKSITSYDKTDIEMEGIGLIVPCVETIFDDNTNGKIEFRGTIWSARSIINTIEKGENVRIVSKDNLTYLVEKL